MKTSTSLPSAVSGRSAIVTGGGGQLGRAIAIALAARGCRVGALDLSEEGLATLTQHGIPVRRCDLLDPEVTRRCVDELADEIGPISILVNAVGLLHSAPLVNIAVPPSAPVDVAGFRQVLDANLTSVFVITAIMTRRMVATRTKGVVISLSSVAAEGNAGQGAYAAAKAGVNAATAAWAKELGPLGIRFVAIAPGFIDTSSTRGAVSEPILQEWARRTPTRALGTPGDVCSAVLFAIENPHLNGKVLSIDGGLSV